MALITFDEISIAGGRRYGERLLAKSAASILEEDTRKFPMDHAFDIFLSHSYADGKLDRKRLLNLKAFLENFGYEVYVDWIIDADLNREQVSAQTARWLRSRMNHSKCLLFATSENSQESKWMPWELGYMDGTKDRVAILPLSGTAGSTGFKGQEYLGVYPYIDKTTAKGTDNEYLWVNEDSETYVRFDFWLAGQSTHNSQSRFEVGAFMELRNPPSQPRGNTGLKARRTVGSAARSRVCVSILPLVRVLQKM